MADKYTTIDNRGATGIFKEAMAKASEVWKSHCMMYDSNEASEEHVWVGEMAEPRRYLSGRALDTLGEYSLTVENYTYELSYLYSRESLEDDKHKFLEDRINDMATVWANFKDSLFAAMLIAGETSTATFDGSAFHGTTRTIGSSAAINNAQTQNINDPNSPTIAEMKTTMAALFGAMWRYESDKGVAGYNAQAMKDVRCAIPPEYEPVFTELIESTTLSQSDNPYYKGLVSYGVLPYLTDADNAFYTTPAGDKRMGAVYQQRVPLEVRVLNSPDEIAKNDGLMVLSRERFRFAYGDPRRGIRMDFT